MNCRQTGFKSQALPPFFTLPSFCRMKSPLIVLVRQKYITFWVQEPYLCICNIGNYCPQQEIREKEQFLFFSVLSQVIEQTVYKKMIQKVP